MSISEGSVDALAPPYAHPGVAPASPQAPLFVPSAAPTEETAVAQSAGHREALAARPPSVTAEQFIREAMAIIDAARPMPLSTTVMINRDEVMTLLESALAAVPDETRQARWLLHERDEVLAQARVDANMIIDEARSRVAQMVQRTEVVRSAERRARQLLDDAQFQSRRRRHEVDEYCERQLAQFASAFDQIQIAVQAARRKLGRRIATPVTSLPADALPADTAESQRAAGSSPSFGSGPYTNPPDTNPPDTNPPDTNPMVFDQDQV